MRLADLLPSDFAVVPLPTSSRTFAVSMLVDALRGPERPPSHENPLKDAIQACEAVSVVSVGNGIAILHIRSTLTPGPRLVVGRPLEPIPFSGKPASLILALGGPDGGSAPAAKALSALRALAADKKLSRSLVAASSAGEVRGILASVF